jgi:Domain of unknown function (DUF6894)
MPRYYFHVRFDDHDETDVVGLELPNLATAIEEAKQARAELMTENELDQLWLEIADQSGRVLAKVG